ncbi:hypothetical protein LLG46_01985 [bacterium]|nr:hypothetical protein [bacterium]
MDSQILHIIISSLGYLVPLVVAYLLKSPLGTYIPTAVAEVLEKLDANSIRELYDAVDTAAERRETAINAIMTISAKYGVAVSSKTAAAVVDYITARIRKLAK